MSAEKPEIKPEPPKILGQLEWFRLHWKQHWRLIGVAAVITLSLTIDWKGLLGKREAGVLADGNELVPNHDSGRGCQVIERADSRWIVSWDRDH